jgi:iodotyrosine deiodinase
MTRTKVIEGYEFIEYQRPDVATEELVGRSSVFCRLMSERRSVRDFSERPVPREVIDNIILAASTAPSGAHKQPWSFCVVSDPAIKKQIRTEAEKEEYNNYHGRMSAEWLEDLRPLQTDWKKDFLETAPYLVVIFKKIYEKDREGRKRNNYYVQESVGIACGFLLAAIHAAGLVGLTHTPSPMNFLSKILQRPENEKPFLLIPVGYPAGECFVPKLTRKPLEEIRFYY